MLLMKCSQKLLKSSSKRPGIANLQFGSTAAPGCKRLFPKHSPELSASLNVKPFYHLHCRGFFLGIYSRPTPPSHVLAHFHTPLTPSFLSGSSWDRTEPRGKLNINTLWKEKWCHIWKNKVFEGIKCWDSMKWVSAERGRWPSIRIHNCIRLALFTKGTYTVREHNRHFINIESTTHSNLSVRLILFGLVFLLVILTIFKGWKFSTSLKAGTSRHDQTWISLVECLSHSLSRNLWMTPRETKVH